jgi:hypothetical protein
MLALEMFIISPKTSLDSLQQEEKRVILSTYIYIYIDR